MNNTNISSIHHLSESLGDEVSPSKKQFDLPNMMNVDSKPMSVLQSLCFFGIPALIFFVSANVIYPLLIQTRLSDFDSTIVTLTIPFALMIPASIYFYRRDGYAMQWRAFGARMRFNPFHWRHVPWAIVVIGAGILMMGLGQMVATWLLENGYMTIPAYVPPLLNQLGSEVDISNPDVWSDFVGGPIHNNWRVVVLFFVMLFFNNVGEEIWWRGYILPRQIATYGRWAWLIHGTLWAFFHIFKWWDIPVVWPLSLVLSYVAQRTHSSWPGLIAHTIINSIGFWIVIFMVIGEG
ncbi:CPBP family intramembrane metalloprotease [Chloroflexi bacterium TSY]|nr:CPBP family intramembrane metalloprotease [Chloroflexi bacterium TSY]